MEHEMGEKRKEGSRGSGTRGDARSGEVGRGTRESSRPRSRTGGPRGRRSSSARVIHLHEKRRALRRGTGGTGRTAGGSPTGNAALTVGRRRLRIVAVGFIGGGFLLGGGGGGGIGAARGRCP